MDVVGWSQERNMNVADTKSSKATNLWVGAGHGGNIK